MQLPTRGLVLTKRVKEDPSYLEIVWGQFRKRRLAYFSMWGVVVLFFIAVYCPIFVSNKPFLWQVDDGPLSSPWLSSLFDRNFFENSLDIAFNSLMLPGTFFFLPLIAVWKKTAHLLRRERTPKRKRALKISLSLWLASFIGILIVSDGAPKTVYPTLQTKLESQGKTVSAVYPVMPYSYRQVNLNEVREDVSFRHPLGTDNAGRDVFSRMVYGTRISLTIGIFAVAIYVFLGICIGSIAGYYGGRVDIVIQRFIEVVMSIPGFFLILTVAAFIENRSIFHIMLIIALIRWTGVARLVRGEFLKLKGQDFVQAARALGFKERVIIFQHVLPNALGPVLVAATFGVAAAILVESTMSFLGLGDITVPSWGQILNTGRTTNSWTLILAPGFAIFLTVSLLNLMGEGIRDAFDPKLRK